MPFITFFRTPALGAMEHSRILQNFSSSFASESQCQLVGLASEYCYSIEWEEHIPDMETLHWLLGETWEPELLTEQSIFTKAHETLSGTNLEMLVEFGPRLSFNTAWSTNATSICKACGLKTIKRIERSRRLKFVFSTPPHHFIPQYPKLWKSFLDSIHDRMTEMIYEEPFPALVSKNLNNLKPASWTTVDVIGEGKQAMDQINKKLGLAFDDQDTDYYTQLFVDKLKRNPTTVELFDISQSNSEHSRHWFFKGKIIIDGHENPKSLMELVQSTLEAHKTNSVLAFCDNSSAIRGVSTLAFMPQNPASSSQLITTPVDYDIIFTAETHNFPTGIAPFPGAETGTGGRLRDTHATGKGSLVLAGTVGYSVGQLHIPGYILPWENDQWEYPSNMAKPLQIAIEASNGASDYANKFGEPLVVGYTRSFGMELHSSRTFYVTSKERREYIKPIMFTGGIGQLDHRHVSKSKPEKGMVVVKVGGPAYRIGLGGGAASSMIQGENESELDFNAVQRGDAEMEQKLNRVVRACVELGERNPIISIHDQGAGGNANVLKELVDPLGAVIHVRDVPVGDFTLSALEIWSAEYQENDALLIKEEHKSLFQSICERESCVFAFVGTVTDDGTVILKDSMDQSIPFNLPLEAVLGKMPRKSFKSEKYVPLGEPLSIPSDLSMKHALDRVLRHLAVCSKRFLTTKIDRSVTGLVAQQPCVGPLHIPVADFGATAQSYWTQSGMATSIGEQPIKGLISPAAMGRLTVGEALTNIVFAKLSKRGLIDSSPQDILNSSHTLPHHLKNSSLRNIKASGNWMWPAKLPGEADAIYCACEAMSNVMIQLGVSIDGGKDSLSMAAKSSTRKDAEIVKAPGTLVVSLYAPMDHVLNKITPAIRKPGESSLIFIDFGLGKQRMGGSILAQTFNQIGNDCPDLDDPSAFANAWNAIQDLIDDGLILSGHDRSDGGLITTVLEMAFAGNCGLELKIDHNDEYFDSDPTISSWMNEELGVVIEVLNLKLSEVMQTLELKTGNQKFVHLLGVTTSDPFIKIVVGSTSILDTKTTEMRDIWEATSFEIEKLQANRISVEMEQLGLSKRRPPPYKLTFKPRHSSVGIRNPISSKHRVGIIREEGSNGDREMAAAFEISGFEVWDINMKDLSSGNAPNLDMFRGLAFVGGFSYADVMDSAKGWAGVIRFNERLTSQFDHFVNIRKDTFTLGVCNGCQLMALLGTVPWPESKHGKNQPRFIHNQSGRFESRFTTVSILDSPSIMLSGMQGSTLGVWLSHGEGQAHFPDHKLLYAALEGKLAPIRYVDDDGGITEDYPFNANGSPHGIAALCSPDGRHLAMMPHPERTTWAHNWPWIPEDWPHFDPQNKSSSIPASPWMKMFQNAFEWCNQKL